MTVVNSLISHQLLLGIRPGMRIAFVNPPAEFIQLIGELPPSVSVLDSCPTGLDLILLFSSRKMDLVERLPKVARSMALTGCIWVVHPSQSAPHEVHTDRVGEEFVRFAALEMGLVDNKRLILDAQWKALRLVWPKKPPRPEKPSHFPT